MLKKRPAVMIGLVTFVILGLSMVELIREPVFPAWDLIALEMIEAVVMVGAIGVVAWTVHGLQDLRDENEALRNNFVRSAAQGDAWRAQQRREIEALGQAIEDQFQHWHLSTAEIDVAGLMLKGVSQKEIAAARNTTEATIRQQAQSIYRKSGLSGRAELSAYFLESLFQTADDVAREKPNLTVITARS